MDRNKILILFDTVKYLKPVQIYYRIFYYLRNRFSYQIKFTNFIISKIKLSWVDFILFENSYLNNNEFVFLNKLKVFDKSVDWNYSNNGKLWTYNLNYFDFLIQKNINIENLLSLINDYVDQDHYLKEGKEPYVISLRGINWIKFLSKNQIDDVKINNALYNHYQILIKNLEYHILGNHLLENGFSLLFGAYYFEDIIFYEVSKKIIEKELEEQILDDGAHFELSPMYHQIMLFRVLDAIQLIQLNNWQSDQLVSTLKRKAQIMISWLVKISFKNGDIPMVNDCASGIAPSSNELILYANLLNISPSEIKLSKSGYRVFEKENYELFVDVGNIFPSYQPGHAHSDTFNFILYVSGRPVIVDTGTSTYEKNERRQQERGTSSHNTVVVNNSNQSQVWGGFRVAKRAMVFELIEKEDYVEASHDGYKCDGIIHTRSFKVQEKNIVINDFFSVKKPKNSVAYFHFHPEIYNFEIAGNAVLLKNENVKIVFFANQLSIWKEEYDFSVGFNQTRKAIKLKIFFKSTLETIIST